jgi:DNA-binding transcriptional MerR regulator
MATLKELADALGLSERAVRTRIDALDGLLDDFQGRGKGNQRVFSTEALAILQRLEELHQVEGLPIRQAAERVREEIDDLADVAEKRLEIQASLVIQYLQTRLVEVAAERDQWREIATTLQSVLPEGFEWLGKTFPADPGDARLN